MNIKFKSWRGRTESGFLAAIILVLLLFAGIEAQEVVQIEPAKNRLIITPGNIQTGTINIYNQSKEPKNVKVYLEDWSYLPVCDGTKEFKSAGSGDLSAAPWISFVPAEFTIAAFGKKTLNYVVKIPPEAKGGHYAVLFFENYLGEQKPTSEGVSVNLAVRVASLFYIEPKGTINRQARIAGLKITKDQGKFYISINFTNTGNVDITAKANFFIIDEKGMAYARGEFNEVYTFPRDSATLSSSWRETIPKGKYDLILTVDISKALKEAGLGEAPAITKEAQIEIGDNGEVIVVGELG